MKKYPKVTLEVEYGMNVKDPCRRGLMLFLFGSSSRTPHLSPKAISPPLEVCLHHLNPLDQHDVIEDETTVNNTLYFLLLPERFFR